MNNYDYRRREFRFSDMQKQNAEKKERRQRRQVCMRSRKPKRQGSRFQYGKKLPGGFRISNGIMHKSLPWCRKER